MRHFNDVYSFCAHALVVEALRLDVVFVICFLIRVSFSNVVENSLYRRYSFDFRNETFVHHHAEYFIFRPVPLEVVFVNLDIASTT